jgi:hypothetical protein
VVEWLQIFTLSSDGPTSPPTAKLLDVYCGIPSSQMTGTGKYPPAELHTDSNFVRIRFFSDNSVQKEGFALTFMKGVGMFMRTWQTYSRIQRMRK